MQKRIMVCLFSLVAVFLRGDGDAFVNNYQALPAAGRSELNYSRDVYQGAFQDGLKNTNPDYQEAAPSTFLDPNAPPPDPVLNNSQIAGIAVGGAAALAGLGAGGTLIAKKWSKSIDAKIKRQQALGGAQASSATLRFGTSRRVSVGVGLPSVDAHSALQTVPPLPSSAVPGHGIPTIHAVVDDAKTSRRSLGSLAREVRGARALSERSGRARLIRSASSRSLPTGKTPR